MPNKAEQNLMVCDVCLILRGDSSLKWCTYCEPCKKWMCRWCKNSYVRRIHAAVKNIVAKW